MRYLTVTVALLLLAIAPACTKTEPPLLGEPVPLALPSGNNVVGPRLAQSDDGTTVLSWMQRDKTGASLRYSQFQHGEWQEAIDVVSDPRMFVNWADLPSVTPLNSKHWVAHWLSKSAADTYAYDILLARSSGAGRNWSNPLRPHSDNTPTEHGFVSMYGDGNSAALLWLDGRKTLQAATDDPRRSSMTLRSALVGPQGQLTHRQLVDAMVCDCCQTDVAVASDGPIAVYRNRSKDEIRDIYLSRFIDGQWQAGAPIAEDGWEIAGCPVNGPAIDAHGELVAIAWFSAAANRPVVRAALSSNGGKTFADPVEIASRGTSGHVGVAIIDRHSVAVSWVESDNRGTNAINIRTLTTGGRLGPAQTVGRSNLKRIHPQLVRADDKLLLAWTDEIGGATEVVSVKVPVAGFYER